MPVIEIQDDRNIYRFSGSLLAGPVTTEFARADHERRRPRPRWFEAVLYARDDDSGYVVAQANRSRVWHQPDIPDGHVRKPERIIAAHLPPDAVYCGALPPKPGRYSCPPSAAAAVLSPFSAGGAPGPDAVPAVVITERPQRRVFRCRDYGDLIRKVASSGGDGDTFILSAPIRELLDAAARADPAFAAARTVIEL